MPNGHANSVEALRSISHQQKLLWERPKRMSVQQERQRMVLRALAELGLATPREILAHVAPDTDDLNLVQPRITELIDARMLREVDRVIDERTGRRVRRVGLTMSGQMEIGLRKAQRHKGT